MTRPTYKLVAYFSNSEQPQVSYYPTRDELLQATAKAKAEGATKVESGPVK